MRIMGMPLHPRECGIARQEFLRPLHRLARTVVLANDEELQGMRKSLLAVSLLALAALRPLSAGTVYVPIAQDVTANGERQYTEVWVSNTGTQTQTAKTLFLEANTDGTDRGKALQTTNLDLTSRKTLVLHPAVDGKRGMFEITGNSALVVNARIVTVDATGAKRLGAFVPALTSANIFGANSTADLQGFIRDDSTKSHLGVVNLGHAAASCQVTFNKAGGLQIGSSAIITVKPLSQLQFDDALGTLGETAVSDVRATVGCNQNFWAYGLVDNGTSAELGVITPSGSGASGLTVPGDEEPAPEGAVVLSAPGLFLKPVKGGAHSRRFDTPDLTDRSFKRLTIEFDLKVGNFFNRNGGGAHSLFMAIRHDRWNSNVFFANNYLPKGNLVRSTTNIDMGSDRPKSEVRYGLKTGVTYHIKSVYWPAQKLRTTQLFVDGEAVVNLSDSYTGKLTFPAIAHPRNGEKPGLMLKFGHEGSEGGGEEWTEGWEYMNLRAVLEP